MGYINFHQYADKNAYNNLPIPEEQHLAQLLAGDCDTVNAMNLN